MLCRLRGHDRVLAFLLKVTNYIYYNNFIDFNIFCDIINMYEYFERQYYGKKNSTFDTYNARRGNVLCAGGI